MGMFDDLIPQQSGGMFDDLIPQKPESRAPAPNAPAINQPQVSTMGDIVRSAGTGLRQGTEAIAGTIGDIDALEAQGVDWLASKIPGLAPYAEAYKKATLNGIAPTTEQIHAATVPVIGENYQPQTTPGKFAEKIGEYAPAAVAGPGGIVRKAVTAVAPAVAGEAAREAFEGTSLEPYAEATGALAGGLAGVKAPSVAKLAAEGAPSRGAVSQATNALYDRLRNSGVTYDRTEFGNMVMQLENRLKAKGIRPATSGGALGLFKDLTDMVGNSPDFSDISSIREAAGQLARTYNPNAPGAQAGGAIIRDFLEQFEGRAPLVQATGNTMGAAEFNQTRKAARELALRNIKAREIQNIIDNAPTYQSGTDSGLRNGASNLLRSKRGKTLFRPGTAEHAALQEVAKGTMASNALRTLGRFGVDFSQAGNIASLIPGAATIAPGAYASYETGDITPLAGSLALAAAGSAAKVGARKMTQAASERAMGTVLAGRKAQAAAAEKARLERLRANLQRILISDVGVRPLELTLTTPRGQPTE